MSSSFCDSRYVYSSFFSFYIIVFDCMLLPFFGQCKRLVFEYGPLILSNAEQFLEKTDMCNAIHACDSPSANNNQATLVEKAPMLSVM